MEPRKGDPIERALVESFRILGRLIKKLFYGVKRLKTTVGIIGFMLSFLFVCAAAAFQAKIFSIDAPVYAQWGIYGLLIAAPLIYLVCLGQTHDKKIQEYDNIFKEIGFIGKDKKYPCLMNKWNDGKKTIYVFKSNISFPEWKKAKERLETGLNCSIRKIEEGKNKKTVILTTVSTDYRIPEMLPWNDRYISNEESELIIGESDLTQIKFDLNRTPHVLAAGETGSGKSVVLRLILWQMINRGCRLFMVDFKGGVEFGKQYEKYGEVIMSRERALKVFETLIEENAKRLELFRDLEVKNLKEYNQKTNSNLCRIGVFIDEIAEMLDKKGVSKEDKMIFEQLEGALSTLARLSRATGINLFLGVQRPDANVLTGQIKNNVPVRISGRFADKSASEIVLGNTAACDLPDVKGRFLYKVGNETVEFQAFYFDDEKMLHEVSVKQGNMLIEKNNKKNTAIATTENNSDRRPKPQTTLEKGYENEVDLDLHFD